MTLGRRSRIASAIAAGAAALTAVFTAQDVMRRALATGASGGLAQALAVNGLDWVVWACLVPLIIAIGARRRLDDAAHRSAHVAAWISLGIVCCLTHSVLTGVVLRAWQLIPPANRAAAALPMWRFLLGWTTSTTGFNVIILLMIAGLFHAVSYDADLRARRASEADLEARLARAELNVLRMQLHPHFLFNTLHTVSSLMVSDVPTAQRVLTALGDLLRTSIDHTASQEITLRAELGFLARYIDIQRARFRQRLTVVIDVAPALLDAIVPSLVLQPLVENAIRHAIEPSAIGGSIAVAAGREGHHLVLVVRDDGSGARGVVSSDRGGGVGLANIEARLTQLYGADQRFHAGRGRDGGFEVTLSFPFRVASAIPIDLPEPAVP